MDISKIFEEHYRYIYSYAVKLTGNLADAEDLTQDVFLIAVKKIGQLENQDSVKYWLRSICLNSYLMKRRKSANYKEVLFNEIQNKDINATDLLRQVVQPEVDDELIVAETIQHIKTVCFLTLVHRMSEKQRIVFALIDMFGLSVSNVSELLDMSISAVKSQLNRARNKLNDELLSKCGLLNVKNPCNCKAWETFVVNREERKSALFNVNENKKITSSDVERKQVVKEIRRMFSEMSGFEPSKEWYERVISEFKKIV